METKLFKTSIAEYTPAEWTGKNESGVLPVGDRVLIKTDVSPEVIRGITYTPDVIARHTMAAEAGVLVAKGEGAFKWNADKMTPFVGRSPEPGDRVCVERYSGQVIKGDDGATYRLMESLSIGGILEKDSK